MPNWCTNRLIVWDRRSEGKEWEEFKQAITILEVDPLDPDANEYDLTLPHPTPEILRGTRSPMQTRESVEKMRVDRDAGKLKAHDGHPGPLTANGSWCTDERLQADLDQIEQGEKAEKETGYNNWYDWNLRNWGVKWQPEVHTVVLPEYPAGHPLCHQATLSYQTAWGPAENLILKLSELYPRLSFVESYLEEGMGFWGANTYEAGECRHSYYGSDDEVLNSLAKQYDSGLDDEDDGTAEMDAHEAMFQRWQELMDRAETDALSILNVLT